MIGKTLRIREVHRFPSEHGSDSLSFTDGVNVIIGQPNTGKSMWLAIIDFLLGDTDSAKDTLGLLSRKYTSARMNFLIGDAEHTVERRWSEQGSGAKIFLDGRKFSDEYFSDFIFDELGIPQVRYPQSSGRWRDVTWRMLMRHMFRHEGQWDDIAPKQFSTEIHACLMTFVGLAKKLFPDEKGTLADTVANKIRLEAKREQFQETLNDVSRDILASSEMEVAITEQSISLAVDRLKNAIEQLGYQKAEIIEQALQDTPAELEPADRILTQDWAKLRELREVAFEDVQDTERRINDLETYKAVLTHETEKLRRAYAAGSILSEIKVTNCPLCDQVIEVHHAPEQCRLCKRSYDAKSNAGAQRLELESQQIAQDLAETEDLLKSLRVALAANRVALRELDDRLFVIETRLRPLRNAATAIQIPEVANIDQEIGGIAEQIKQWERIKNSLAREANLAFEIDLLGAQIKELESEIALSESELDFAQIGDFFESSMNTYLNQIRQSNPTRWSQQNRVVTKFGEKSVSFKINGMNWQTALGGTWRGYFLLAYHYALMASSEDFMYPGFLILDYPKSFEEAAKSSSNANHTLEPFIQLLRSNLRQTQIIAAGKGFSPLEGANTILFEHQWEALN